MVIPQLFAIRRQLNLMACGDKLWSFRTPFRHPEAIVSDGTQRQIMVILRLLSSRGSEPDDMQRQIIIPHLFAIRRRSCLMAHRDKLWSFCAFCHPEAVGLMTCRDKLWSFCIPFCHPETIESDGTQRQIIVILHL